MDAVGIDYPEQLFIKSMTGGAAGDGTIRDPSEVLRDVRTQFDNQALTKSQLEKEIAAGEKPQPDLEDAMKLHHLKQACRTWGTNLMGNYWDEVIQSCTALAVMRTWGLEQCAGAQDGTVRITDIWDVDNPERRTPDGLVFDLAEGGRKATRFRCR